MKRTLARLMYRWVPTCFACGKRPTNVPCPGHEWGGIIRQPQARRFTPWLIRRHVDSRWAL